MNGECLKSGVVYQATVTRTDTNTSETYVGLTGDTFKARFRNHKSNFKIKAQTPETTLSGYVWKLKDSNVSFDVKWKILARARVFNASTKQCNLCLEEKYYIIYQPNMATLNDRNELMNCRHRKKLLLENT